MKFSLRPYIKDELYQLKLTDNDPDLKYKKGNVYLEINLKEATHKEYYNKGFFSGQQIKELINISYILRDNEFIKEIEIDLERKNED